MTKPWALYNEIDPFAAAWLEQLIASGHIAPGVVDRRSIDDLRADDLRGFRQVHFFAGIGVWSYALRRAGVPDDAEVWTGSCPCQPFSAAGKGGGMDDERHLWPSFIHLIRECRPRLVFGEQVASKDGLAWLDLVQTDLEGARYAAGAVDLCAAGVGAPHIRQRLWWFAEKLADAEIDRRIERREDRTGDPEGTGAKGAFGRIAERRGVGRVGDDDDERLEGQRRGHQAEGGWLGEVRSVAETGQLGGVADAASLGWDGRRSGEASDEPGSIKRSARLCAAGGMELSGGERREWRQEAASGHDDDRATPVRPEGQHGGGVAGASGLHQDRTGPTNGHWRDADWLFCRDGKWRPVEPGTFPLAHGAAARVGRLRGYGNAIVAQAAQTFIEAYLDTVDLRLTAVSEMTNDNALQGSIFE